MTKSLKSSLYFVFLGLIILFRSRLLEYYGYSSVGDTVLDVVVGFLTCNETDSLTRLFTTLFQTVLSMAVEKQDLFKVNRYAHW